MPASARRHRRLGLYIPWALFLAAAIGWTIYWNMLRVRMIETAQAAVAAQRAEGAKISYDRVNASGYPLRLTLTFTNAAYEAPGGHWALSAPTLDLHMNPSNLSLVIFETHGTVTWRNNLVIRTLTPRTAALSVRTEKGAFSRAVFEAHDLAVSRNGGAPGTFETLIVGVRPDPRQARDMQVSIDATNLKLAKAPSGFEGFGTTLASIEGRVVIEQADVIETAKTNRVEAWRAAKGVARIEGAGLLWGPARMIGTGRVSLDAQRRPQGRLDMSLTDPAPALSALARPMSPTMRTAMEASAEAAATKGGPLALPLILENGVLSLGPLPVRTLDPIQ